MERDTLLSEKGKQEKSICKHTKKFISERKEIKENNDLPWFEMWSEIIYWG